MTKYFVSVFVIAAIVSLLRLLGYRSGIIERVALGIICIYTVVYPLGTAVNFDFDGVFDIPEINVDSGVDGIIEDAFAEGIARAVADEFSLKTKDISVRLFGFDSERMSAERIEIILSGGAVGADYRAIEDYIRKMEIGECVVEISF